MTVVRSTDADIHYEMSGRGEPLLMMAGSGFAAATWPTDFLQALRTQYTVVTYDQRGTGQSIPMGDRTITTGLLAQDAAVVLDHAGFDSAHVFGHSMGGMVAQLLAADFPQKVRSLVLAASSAGRPDSMPPARAGVPMKVAADLIEQGFTEFSTSKHHEVFFTERAVRERPRMVHEFDEIFLETAPSLRDYLRLVAARTAHSSQAAARTFTMPVLLMVGDEDTGGISENRIQMTQTLAGLIKHARVEYVLGQSHCLLWEEPEVCSRLVLSFLESLEERVQHG